MKLLGRMALLLVALSQFDSFVSVVVSGQQVSPIEDSQRHNRRQLAQLESSEVTEGSFNARVKFSDLDSAFEEKLIAKEMIHGFFEFNQSFGHHTASSSSSEDGEIPSSPLWSYKLIFDTSYDWFSFTFDGAQRHFVSSIGSGDLFERQFFDGNGVVISLKINIPA